MKKGIDFIMEEREKQIAKWGTTDAHDIDHDGSELKTAALFALTLDEKYSQYGFKEFERKCTLKNEIERLAIAGALLAAEIDVIQSL